MTDPQTIAWLDQEDAHLAQVIRAHRWSVQFVGAGDEPGEPPFGYTVGLFGLGHAELVVVGLEPGTASTASSSRVARVVADGRDLVTGELLSWPDWPELRLVVEELPNPGEVVLVANRFYERPAEGASRASLPAHLGAARARLPVGGATGAWTPRELQPRPGTWRA